MVAPGSAGKSRRASEASGADAAGATLQVAADEVAGAVSRLLGALPVADLTVEDP